MEYIKSISIKSIALALIAGHAIPYIGLIVFTLVAGEGMHSLAVSLVIFGWLILIAPTITGYIAAKYCKALPLLNGMLATVIGIILYFTHGEFGAIWFSIIFVGLSILLGYVGTRRFIIHG